jgi:hypothetical protein
VEERKDSSWQGDCPLGGRCGQQVWGGRIGDGTIPSLIISLVCPASEHGLQHGTDARPGSHSRRLSQCMLLVESW